MPLPRRRDGLPSYRLHKHTGQAIVTLNHGGGKRQDVLLGAYNSPESRRKYGQVIAEWLARGRLPEPPPIELHRLTIDELIARFWEGHVVTYYLDPEGKPTSEQDNMRQAMRSLHQLYGELPAREFSPLKLETWLHEVTRPNRQVIDEKNGQASEVRGWCRTNANRNLKRVQFLFKWATKKELVPRDLYPALLTVEGLRENRSHARESPPVRAIGEPFVMQAIPFLSKPLQAVVRLQLLCGARPSEILRMRGRELDRRKKGIWMLHPERHKNAHRGRGRTIPIKAAAIKVLKPFLKTDPNAYIFTPAEAETERLQALHASRRTPESQRNRPGYSASTRAGGKPRALCPYFKVTAYCRAIARACAKAFPPPPHLARAENETLAAWRARLTPEQRDELHQWEIFHRWHPHQLRHTFGTNVRESQGIEAAQVALGHRTMNATLIYAERTDKMLEDVVKKIG